MPTALVAEGAGSPRPRRPAALAELRRIERAGLCNGLRRSCDDGGAGQLLLGDLVGGSTEQAR